MTLLYQVGYVPVKVLKPPSIPSGPAFRRIHPLVNPTLKAVTGNRRKCPAGHQVGPEIAVLSLENVRGPSRGVPSPRGFTGLTQGLQTQC